jgi:hypothetical protein
VNTVSQLPRFILDLMAAPPRHGEGVHNYLFRLSRVLHPYRDESEIADILRAVTADCGRYVPETEIANAVRDSKPYAWKPGVRQETHTEKHWPSVNHEQREAIVHDGGGLVDLWEASPIRLDDKEPCTEEIIDALFPGDPLLCVGWSNHRFETRQREKLRGLLAETQLIVPSPMIARTGFTQDGKESEHTLANTGGRKFLVTEFDQGTPDEHAAILLHLAERAPLALAVHSGGKSLHGWFYCHGQSEEALLRFMRYAVMLGADRATWTRSQFVRVPDGTRENGNRQTAYFFNPEVVK